jgi:8-oxo-dGTP pyrophosphatase MutT (NUDIX family)
MDKPFAVVALFLDEEHDVLTISRRGVEGDIGLIGGKVEDTDFDAIEAVRREIREEVGVEVERNDLVHIFTRTDGRKDDDKVCECFFVLRYRGRPRAMENGFKVRWASFLEVLAAKNTFASYNQALHAHIVLNPLPAPFSVHSD